MAIRASHLRYLVTVADEGQITRAAVKLNVAQPALSQAISSLESEVGFPLLERHARGVSLTPAGALFLEKARQALAAEADAIQTAQWLARSAEGAIEFGFVGAPRGLDSPGPLAAFSQRNPDIDMRYRELPFPGSSTSSWISEVDVAVCHLPPEDEDVWVLELRGEPRVLLAQNRHPHAGRPELSVAEAMDETFVGFHPRVDPDWAGFWSLDDHRGGPPASVTPDQATGPQEILAALSTRGAVTLVPASVASVIVNVLSGISAIPLTDAAPATIALVGHRDRRNPLVDVFAEFVREALADPRSNGCVQ
jgi:DNA-binding transcriptional LysR family regulator